MSSNCVNQLSDLLAKVDWFEHWMGIIQSQGAAPPQSVVKPNEIATIQSDYVSWYVTALAVIHDDLKKEFREQYEGKGMIPQGIKSFLAEPLAVTPDFQEWLNPETRSNPRMNWRYPYTRYCESQLRRQAALLRESKARYEVEQTLGLQVSPSKDDSPPSVGANSQLALDSEKLLVQLYTASTAPGTVGQTPLRIPTHGNRTLSIVHPAFPDGEIHTPWVPLNELQRAGYLTYDFRRVGDSQIGVIRLNTKARDYIHSLTPEKSKSTRGPRVFIVHGHDDKTKFAVKNYLQNTLGLPEPIILHEVPNRGRTLIEKFEQTANDAEVAVILLTPDDRFVEDGSDQELRRARQNVIFEMGYFLALLGRASGKVLLLHSGSVELPSDISGIVYIDISNGVESVSETIRAELGIH